MSPPVAFDLLNVAKIDNASIVTARQAAIWSVTSSEKEGVKRRIVWPEALHKDFTFPVRATA